MNRFTMTLTAAAASAVVAGAIVALPAIGDDSNNGPSNVAALAACLRSHGLDGAPDDPAALKPWIAQRASQDPLAVKQAMNACQQYQTGGPDKPKVEEKREATAAEVQKLVACLRANGLDAPSDPAALKRWFGQKEAGDHSATDRIMLKCKMQLDPEAGDKAGKPGGPAGCGDDAGPKPTEPATKPDAPATKPDAPATKPDAPAEPTT
jgi:hypothetical protein